LLFYPIKILRGVKEIAFSPLLGRELRVFLRSGKSFLALFLFLMALLAVVNQNWSAFVRHWAPGGDIAGGAREFFFALAQGHLLFLMIATPFLMTPLIAGEREQSTLPLLLSSPISVTHLILAKGLIPLLFVVLLLMASMPSLSLCFLGGGLSGMDLLQVYLIFLSAALSFGSLGFFCSTLRTRIYEVYFLAAIMVLLYGFLLPFHGTIWSYLGTMKWEGVNQFNHGFQYLSPYVALREEIGVSRMKSSGALSIAFVNLAPLFSSGAPPTIRLNLGPLWHLALSGSVSLLFFLLSAWRVKRIALGEDSTERIEEEWEEEEEDSRLREYNVILHGASEEKNPGLFLERKAQWFARASTLLRLFYISLMISILTLPLSSFQGSWLFLSLPFMAAALFTLPLAATSISGDRERATLDLLRTSLLTSKQIVWAKFVTNLQYSFIVAIALYMPGMLAQFVCGWFFGLEVDLAKNRADAFAIAWCPILLFCALSVYTSLGLYCSARFRRTNQALIVSGAVIFATLILPFLLPDAGVFGLRRISTWALLGFSFLSPLAGVSIVFPEGSINMPGIAVLANNVSNRIFTRLFPSTALPASGYAGYFFAAAQGVFCLALCYGLLRWTIRAMENED